MVEYWAAGGRMVEVNITKRGKKIALRFRKFRPLIDEVRCMKGAEYLAPEKGGPAWLVTRCRRNRMQMDIMAGRPVPELARYLLPHGGTPKRTNLKPHQIPMFRFMFTVRRGVLAAEMGTMKTLPTIDVMEQVGGDWWYVSTPRVLDSIKIEFEKWGAKIQPKWVSIFSLRKTLEQHRGPAPKGVVFDEASFLKGKGAWYRAAQYLANCIRQEHDGYVILLTGTPQPLDPTDWHSLAEIVCPGFLRESTKPHLTRRLAIMKKVKHEESGKMFSHVVGWKKDEVERLGRRLSGLAYVVFSRDCQSLPPLREEFVHLKPDKATLRAARLVVDTSINAAQALNKVRQLSDGFQYTEDGSLRCDTPKDDALRTFLARNEEVGRTIIYAPYRESIDRTVDVCLGEGWSVLRCDGRGWGMFGPGAPKKHKEWLKEMDRSLMQSPRQVPRLAFVGHPRSGGFGLNLTACREGAWFSSDFDGGAYEQGKKRPHREGMDLNHGFTWYHFFHLPTDAYVYKNLQEKRDLTKITLEELKRVLSGKAS